MASPNIIDKGSMYTGNSAFGTTVQFSLLGTQQHGNSRLKWFWCSNNISIFNWEMLFIPPFYASYYTENSTSVYSHSSNKAANSVWAFIMLQSKV
ncbi:hypothetical protein AB6G29_22420 [Providencia hangzhouensis]|uniref:hypothetical protein n=1 Tax=Providencia hangzhouensis TaxID=3031799 RepID=UPI0034DD4427